MLDFITCDAVIIVGMNNRTTTGAGRRVTAMIVIAAGLSMGAVVYFSKDRDAVGADYAVAPTRRIDGSAFQVLLGEGTTAAAGAELRKVAINGQGVVAALADELAADTYRAIRFATPGIESATGSAIYWHRKTDPAVSHYKALTLDQVRNGEIILTAADQWSGQIQTFGFVVQGPLKQPVTIKFVEFSERPLDE